MDIAVSTGRTSRFVAVLCIAAVVVAAVVPSLAASTLGTAIFVPLWLVVPAVSIIVIRRSAARCDEQPVALLSLVLSRAPPRSAARS
jgi:undecaprenyl pyrophosphate phosphatase UppP